MGIYIFGTHSDVPESEENNSLTGITIRLGYRYQGKKGLLLRAAPNLTFIEGDVVLLPALSIGYSF